MSVTYSVTMGRHKLSPDDVSRNALAQRRSRERRKARASAEVGTDLAGIMSDELADDPGSDSLTPAGLVGDYSNSPSSESPASHSLEGEQALWVRRRREITELELAKRRGELVPIADVRTQSAAMGRRIRIALDKIPQHLPAHLSPETRAECERAIAVAVSAAMEAV